MSLTTFIYFKIFFILNLANMPHFARQFANVQCTQVLHSYICENVSHL